MSIKDFDFVTLSLDTEIKPFVCKPSVKIGRLAVAKNYEGHDIVSDILNFIKIAFTNKNRTGCRFITLDAYADVVDFYLKNGFNFFTDKDKNDKTRLMYFDLKPFKDAQRNI